MTVNEEVDLDEDGAYACAECDDLDSGDVTTSEDLDGDGWTTCDEDCDDDADTNPGLDEVCDGIDNDCDGIGLGGDDWEGRDRQLP